MVRKTKKFTNIVRFKYATNLKCYKKNVYMESFSQLAKLCESVVTNIFALKQGQL